MSELQSPLLIAFALMVGYVVGAITIGMLCAHEAIGSRGVITKQED